MEQIFGECLAFKRVKIKQHQIASAVQDTAPGEPTDIVPVAGLLGYSHAHAGASNSARLIAARAVDHPKQDALKASRRSGRRRHERTISAGFQIVQFWSDRQI